MEITRIFDIVERSAKTFNRPDALAVKRNGKWDKYSGTEYAEYVNALSIGLLELNIAKGTKIASISNNRPEWNILDMGTAQVGVIHVPIYPNIGIEELKHILEHSGVEILLVSSQKFYNRIKDTVQEVSKIKKIYSFDDVDDITNWMEIINLGKANKEKRESELQGIKANIKADDMCTLIYTSGTTGVPKGVMLSHTNFVSNVIVTEDRVYAEPEDRMLSFLPLCHVFERMVNYLFQYKGHPIYYAESVETMVADIRDVKPAGFTAVPRVIEKVYDKIILKGKGLKGIQKNIFFWAVQLGYRYRLNNANGRWYSLKLKIANKLVFSKWRESLGGNVKFIVSGGASLQTRLERVFHAAGLVIQTGYGLTETSPVIAVSYHDYPDLKIGTVGPTMSNLEVKIADDGEILVKGPSVMLGYYNDPEATKEVIDSEGWFHTGDIGFLHERNILQITDRKKSMFKLSSGKYISPQGIENKLKESPFIEHAMIIGENEKFASALISPSFEYLHGWCQRHQVDHNDNKQIVTNTTVLARIKKDINRLNKQLGQHEHVKKFELMENEWSTNRGELSPTLKLRRNVIAKKYKSQIDSIYNKNLKTTVL